MPIETVQSTEFGIPNFIADDNKYAVAWPDSRGGTNQATIAACKALGLINAKCEGHATEADYRTATGQDPEKVGSPKHWRWNVWDEREIVYAVYPQRDSDGNFIPLKPVATGRTVDDETFRFFGPSVQEYLQAHSDDIGEIPKLIAYGIRREGAMRISFASGSMPFDWPIAILIWDEGGPIELLGTANVPVGMLPGLVYAAPSINGPHKNRVRVGNRLDGDFFPWLYEGKIYYAQCKGFRANNQPPSTPGVKYLLTPEQLAKTSHQITTEFGINYESGLQIRAAAEARK